MAVFYFLLGFFAGFIFTSCGIWFSLPQHIREIIKQEIEDILSGRDKYI